MLGDLRVYIRLSAQRALWGQVPPNLRAVSVDADEQKVYFRCVFDGQPTEEEWELLSEVASEIIADFPAPYTIEEEYLSISSPLPMTHLKYLVYLRYEQNEAL
jgi:hypothetical protein